MISKIARLSRTIDKLNKQKAKYNVKLTSAEHNTFYIGNREKAKETYTKLISETDKKIYSTEHKLALAKERKLKFRARRAVRKITGASVKDLESSGFSFDEIVENAKTNKKKLKETNGSDVSSKKKAESIADLDVPEKKNLEKQKLKEIKKLSSIDAEIRDEIKIIRENQIDEQDTNIKKKPEKIKLNKLSGVKDSTRIIKSGSSSMLNNAIIAGLSIAMLKEMLDEFWDDLSDLDKKKARTNLKIALTAPKTMKAALKTPKVAMKIGEKIGGKIASKVAMKKVIDAEKLNKLVAKTKPSLNAVKNVKNVSKVVKDAKFVTPNEVKNAQKMSKLANQKVSKILGKGFKRAIGETNKELAGRITAKMLQKQGAKLTGKKVPLVGLSIASGMAYMRWKEGGVENKIKAGLELASGIASIFPGLGTGASMAIDAGLIFSDVQEILDEIEKQEAIESEAKKKKDDEINSIMLKKNQAKLEKTLKSDDALSNAKERYNNGIADMKSYVLKGNVTPEEINKRNKVINDAKLDIKKRTDELKLQTSDEFISKQIREEELKKNKVGLDVLRQQRDELVKKIKKNKSRRGYNTTESVSRLKIVTSKINDIKNDIDNTVSQKIKKIHVKDLESATKEYNKKHNITESNTKYKKFGYNLKKLKHDLMKDEGMKYHSYKDTEGNWTIGVGHLMQQSGGISTISILGRELSLSDVITRKDTHALLDWDISRLATQLYKSIPWLSAQPEPIQRAIMNLTFNIGVQGTLKFSKTLNYIHNRKYTKAAEEIQKSRWSKQVSRARVQRQVKRILSAEGMSIPEFNKEKTKSKLSSKNSLIKNVGILISGDINTVKHIAKKGAKVYNTGSSLVKGLTGFDGGHIDYANTLETRDNESTKITTDSGKLAGRKFKDTSTIKRAHSNVDLNNLEQVTMTSLKRLGTNLGRPIVVTSAYRSPEYNASVGGAKNSLHKKGLATDIIWDKKLSKSDFIKLGIASGFSGGIGIYDDFVHMDNGKPRAWGPNGHNNTLPEWARQAIEDGRNGNINVQKTSMSVKDGVKEVHNNNVNTSNEESENESNSTIADVKVNKDKKAKLVEKSANNLTKVTKKYNSSSHSSTSTSSTVHNTHINKAKPDNTQMMDTFVSSVDGIP